MAGDRGEVYFGSLFAGIGGIDLGLERAGMTCRWQVENNLFCNRILKKHWPDVKRYKDVKMANPRKIERGCGGVRIIAGGFPCQDLSCAGQRAGIHAARSGLWFEFKRFIRDLRPEVVLVENVSGILSRGLAVVLRDLASLRYDAEWDCIPAAIFGAPHLRRRIFIVAYPEGSRLSGTIFPSGDESQKMEHFKIPAKSHDDKKIEGWPSEPDVGRVVTRLPPSLDQTTINRLTALGNSVVPQITEWVGNRIIASLSENIIKN